MATSPAAYSAAPRFSVRNLLLSCGIASSLVYVAVNVIVTLAYPGYDVLSQAPSELSAIGAPTRSLWIILLIPYTLLLLAFGWGVWMSAAKNRLLRVVGALFLFQGAVCSFWPPMHMRGAEFSFTDTMHIVFTAIWGTSTIVAIILAAIAFGGSFRFYSIATLFAMIVFGTLTGMLAPALQANQPTPLMGLWERISIAVVDLWIIVLAMRILATESRPVPARII